MLETIAVVLILLWILGMVSSYTLGGFIHVLLVVAIVVILIRVIQGRFGSPFLLQSGSQQPIVTIAIQKVC